MKGSISKWILVGYGLIWVVWLSLHPSPALESSGSAADSSSPPSLSSKTEKASFPSPSNDNERCRRCHGQPEKSKIDFKDPTCIECHSAEDERTLPANDLFSTPTPVTVALSSPTQPNKMIYIPAGVFLMGSNGRSAAAGPGDLDEAPLHKVHLDGFYIDQHEVTNAQYKAFVDTTGRRTPRHWKANTIPPGKENHPVIYVSWFEANDFCHWVGKRLLTEAEWEKAARGTDGRTFPWGNTFDPMKANIPQRWLALEQKGDTMPVGSFEEGKSPYGVYDMAGNVYEWTSNWYKPYPRNRIPNAHYGEKNKIVRGGSWYDCLSYGCGLSAPTYNRSRFTPAIRNKSFGFRCAKSE